ncbi:hypothetical protein D3C81_1610570 [compost metagenome]
MIPFTKKRWKNGYTIRIGNTTIIVTVILTEVGVCMLATLAAMSVELRIKAARELDSFKYLQSKNCKVKYFVSVIKNAVSIKAFHWLTAEKIVIVARIGVVNGTIMLQKDLIYPAPSICADSSSAGGIASTKVLTRMILNGVIIVGKI